MKRILLALLAVVGIAASAQAQSYKLGEVVIPFRSTGLASGTPLYGANAAILTLYADSSYTKRGGAAWGATVNSQTDTTVWFGTSDFPGFTQNMATRAGKLEAADTSLVFRMFFQPDPAGVAEGLTAGADTIYATLQGTNDGGQNVSSATWNQVVNPTSSNGFSRAMYSQIVGSGSAITLSTFLQFKQWRLIISSDINGRYSMSAQYPKNP